MPFLKGNTLFKEKSPETTFYIPDTEFNKKSGFSTQFPKFKNSHFQHYTISED